MLGAEDDSFGLSTHAGDKATFAGVCDELETMPFFSARRLIIVENADPFVTKFRGLLEKKVNDLPKTAVLVLEVRTWASNTKLANGLENNNKKSDVFVVATKKHTVAEILALIEALAVKASAAEAACVVHRKAPTETAAPHILQQRHWRACGLRL